MLMIELYAAVHGQNYCKRQHCQHEQKKLLKYTMCHKKYTHKRCAANCLHEIQQDDLE